MSNRRRLMMEVLQSTHSSLSYFLKKYYVSSISGHYLFMLYFYTSIPIHNIYMNFSSTTVFKLLNKVGPNSA